MKKYFFLLLISSLVFFSCSSNTEKNAQAEKESYELSKENLLKKEQKNPTNFLIVSGGNKRNLIGQTVVKGNITNKATVAVYKDVGIRLSFYSKTKTLLETDKETIFEIWHPGETKNFKTKYFAPKGTDSVALEVLGAKLEIP